MIAVSLLSLLGVLIVTLFPTFILFLLVLKSKVPSRKKEIIEYLYESTLVRLLNLDFYFVLMSFSVATMLIYTGINSFINNLIFVLLIFIFSYLFWKSVFNLIIKLFLLFLFKKNNDLFLTFFDIPFWEIIVIILGIYFFSVFHPTKDLYFLLSAGIMPAIYLSINKTLFRNWNLHVSKFLKRKNKKLLISNNLKHVRFAQQLYEYNANLFGNLISSLEQNGFFKKYSLTNDSFKAFSIFIFELTRTDQMQYIQPDEEIKIITAYMYLLNNNNRKKSLVFLKSYWNERINFYKMTEQLFYITNIRFKSESLYGKPLNAHKKRLFKNIFGRFAKISKADFEKFIKLIYEFEIEFGSEQCQ